MPTLPRTLRRCQTAVACALAFAPVALSRTHYVTAVRHWSLGEVTRVAVEANGSFEFHADRLPNPERVFVDMPGTKPRLGPRGMLSIPVDDAMLRQIRVAETQLGVTRIVFDLAGATEFTTSKLSNPDRLIIEFHRNGPNVKAAAHAFVPPVEPAVEPVETSTPTVPPAPVLRTSPRAPVPIPATLTAAATLAAPVADAPAELVLAKTTPLETSGMRRRTPASFPEKTLDPSPIPARHGPHESMIRALGLKVGRVVIDAGHGGHDVGSIGPGGFYEKDLTLDVARRLGALIEQRMGSEVVYTRPDDTFIPLERRTEIANERKADLFLSIHANSSQTPSATGVETYYLNFTTSRSALELAARENAGAQRSISELQPLLQKIALHDKVDESREFAVRVQKALYTGSSRGSHGRDRGVRQAPFVVLIGANMPSVLAEIGFISNPREEALMKRPEHRQKIAEALYKGLFSYAGTLSHFQVASGGRSAQARR